MNGSQNSVTSASLGPIFSLTSLSLPWSAAWATSQAGGRCNPESPSRYVWEKVSVWRGAQGASVLGSPCPGMEGVGAAACDLAFLPLLRASYFAPAQPLCLPGARPSSRSRDTWDAGVMGSRRVNSDLTGQAPPRHQPEQTLPWVEIYTTSYTWERSKPPNLKQWGEEV